MANPPDFLSENDAGPAPLFIQYVIKDPGSKPFSCVLGMCNRDKATIAFFACSKNEQYCVELNRLFCVFLCYILIASYLQAMLWTSGIGNGINL